MSVIVSHFIIHELIKNQDPSMAPNLLDLEDPIVLGLAQDIADVYIKKTSVMWGKFRQGGAFPTELISYTESDSSDDQFTLLTSNSMTRLASNMSGTSGTGGYICFIEYNYRGCNRLLIAMIKNTKGVKLTDLIPQLNVHVDISKLYQALEVNVNNYQSSIGATSVIQSYLGFISKKGEPSDYFQSAFSCTDNVTPTVAVKKSPKALEAYLKQYTDSASTLKSADTMLVNYFKDNLGSVVTLQRINEIANAFLPEDVADEARDGFLEFAKTEDWQLPDHFNAVKGAVESMSRISFSSANVSVNFDRQSLGVTTCEADEHKPILFDPNGDKLILKDLSREFIQAIEQELNSNS
ncbi:hypothetical protein GCM10007978_05180 [Shewanella hanedai]|uniref:Nucleoid-associated protein n=1 Tax=Shewanella hanedai TaxID=25 RepID=A0A553JTT0_SHEHA|nr:nucleoid-associated protein [Shewanella hanedai]TRY15831.1 nucleoid-associated protein [Shewanella hanedai]GGI70200.1 hypothetical protein GCM10007978_05180 [Shewanella hanedai]